MMVIQVQDNQINWQLIPESVIEDLLQQRQANSRNNDQMAGVGSEQRPNAKEEGLEKIDFQSVGLLETLSFSHRGAKFLKVGKLTSNAGVSCHVAGVNCSKGNQNEVMRWWLKVQQNGSLDATKWATGRAAVKQSWGLTLTHPWQFFKFYQVSFHFIWIDTNDWNLKVDPGDISKCWTLVSPPTL